MSDPFFQRVTPLLKTEDLSGTIGFYTSILGFTVDRLWPSDNPGLVFLQRGNAQVGFYVDIDETEATPGLTGQIYIDVEGVADLYRRIAEQVTVLWGPEVYSYGRREFAVEDPNGYTVTFSEMTNDPAGF